MDRHLDSFELMKKRNQQIMLEVIHKEGSVSRARMAKLTGLAPATISNNVKDLIQQELVRESSRGESRGGRKPVLLELNPSGAYQIGLEWGIEEIRGVLIDLSQAIIAEQVEKVNSNHPGDFVAVTREMSRYFAGKINHSERIYGIGIGIHGMVNPEQGISLFAPHFNWENVPVRQLVEEQLELSVLVDNDVRMMALAEKWADRDNFIFINTGPGIGAAIVIDGELYYGRDWSAGEFGHMTISESGPRCSCGNYGCLEAWISVERLIRQYKAGVEINEQGWQGDWLELIDQARSGKEMAGQILTTAARHLGTGIANLVNLLNPESIVIGGEFAIASDIIFPIIRDIVREKALRTASRNLEIVPAAFGKRIGSVGAADMVLQDLFELKEEV